MVPDLDGTGVSVAQPEALNPDPKWQVNPQAVGLPTSLFRWYSASGSTNDFPNTLGAASGHANEVGNAFYGTTNGVAPGLAGIENYEATYFVGLIQAGSPIVPRVVNQSFAFGGQNNTIDQKYDDYVNVHGTLFLSGVGNAGAPASPATMWNGIGVGAFGGSSSTGPTTDGRCKPDLSAPASLTSFATPQVAGTAALLLEAITNGVGVAGNAASAADWRTLKAILINGADKPAGWSNAVTMPLDPRYGSGVLNVLRSYEQLRGGQHAAVATNAYGLGGPTVPPPLTGGIESVRGWNLASINQRPLEHGAHHYLFDFTGASEVFDTLDVTLTWARPVGGAGANNLELALYDASTGGLIVESKSGVNNVEHLHVANLPPGRYVIQVLKLGTVLQSLSPSETYAMAFEFVSPLTAGPRLVAPSWEAGTFHVRVEAEPFEAYRVERAETLPNWIPVGTHLMPVTGFFDVDDLVGVAPAFTYRVIRVP